MWIGEKKFRRQHSIETEPPQAARGARVEAAAMPGNQASQGSACDGVREWCPLPATVCTYGPESNVAICITCHVIKQGSRVLLLRIVSSTQARIDICRVSGTAVRLDPRCRVACCAVNKGYGMPFPHLTTDWSSCHETAWRLKEALDRA